MNNHTLSLKVAVACALIWSSSCSESSFTSANGKNGKVDAKKPAAGNGNDSGDPEGFDNGKPDGDAGGQDSGGLDGGDAATAGDLGNADGGGGGAVGDTGAGGPADIIDLAGETNDIVTIDDCLQKKADNYNILLIFDNSGSQKETDPDAVRQQGALAFVDQFADYVKRQPKAIVRFGTLGFNTASIRVGQGWLKVQDDQIQQIKDEITAATSDPNGGTAYSPVLKDAATYYAALNDGDRKIKNYVVFLTDGLPNAAGGGGILGGLVEKMEDIPVAIDTLVSTYDVAMIAIAAGPGIPAEGESITQSLAKPAVGSKDPKHVGVYHRARTTDELKQVWDGLFKSIGSCD